MTPSQEHMVQQALALHAVLCSLISLIALHEGADQVQLSASMKDGRLEFADVTYSVKGKPLGGFGL